MRDIDASFSDVSACLNVKVAHAGYYQKFSIERCAIGARWGFGDTSQKMIEKERIDLILPVGKYNQ